jgi:hypothetical protein
MAAHLTVTITCPDCAGHGSYPNPDFEWLCHLPEDDPRYQEQCQGCPGRDDCNRGELLTCETCSGKGHWEFRSDQFYIRIERSPEYYGPQGGSQ